MLAMAGKALSLSVVSQDICSSEVFDERDPPITARPKNHCNYLFGGWLFYNTFLPLLDGRDHKVQDKHFGWNFYSG